MENESTRVYLIAGSSLLHNKLIELGYTLVETKGRSGTQEVSEFVNIHNKRKIFSGYYEIKIVILESPGKKDLILYRGRSIELERLKYFSRHIPTEIKNG